MSLKESLKKIFLTLKSVQDDNRSKKDVGNAMSRIYSSVKKTLKSLDSDKPQTK